MAKNGVPRVRVSDMADIASMFVFVVGLFLIGILLLFLIRVQRGLLGLILAGLAAALMIYWMREIRQIVRGEFEAIQPSKKKWTYDVLEGKDMVTVVAEVPGPAEDVRVELRDRSLAIFGGQSFKKKVSVPKGLTLIDTSYVNGILNVRLSRLRKAGEDSPRGDPLRFGDT
ncbi:MAG: hypothetical protein ACE5KU_00780 [Nitrososphaerales archaeon]